MKNQLYNYYYYFIIVTALLSTIACTNGRFDYDPQEFSKSPKPHKPVRNPDIKETNDGNIEAFRKLLEAQQENESIFKVYHPGEVKTTFEDVAGLHKVKKSLTNIIDYLKDPKTFTRLGAEPPSGILFYGPPGTGKTEIARAFAGEVGKTRKVTFIVASGASFENKYVGVGADNVSKLFALARKNKPAIIFVDEFDAVAGTRSEEKKNAQVVNQLLTELDGFSKKDRQDIFIVAATNHIKHIDPAVIRPGRIDRKIEIGLPDQEARKAIIMHYFKKEPAIININIESLIHRTNTWSAAELKTMVNEARIHATNRNANQIEEVDITEAMSTIIAGRDNILP